MDIADGLHYLHDFRLLHGDLKCVCPQFLRGSLLLTRSHQANVLVDEKGRAKLADFGLSSIIYEAGSYQKFSLTATPQGTLRWMAPELHDPEDAGIGEDDALLTAASDVYAFAMVMLEVTRLICFCEPAQFLTYITALHRTSAILRMPHRRCCHC